MVARLMISIVLITGCFDAMLAGEATNRVKNAADDRLIIYVQAALERLSFREDKESLASLNLVVMELKQVSGALDNKTLLEFEKLSASLLRCKSPESISVFCSLFGAAEGVTRRSMVRLVHMYALENINQDRVKKVLVSLARSDGAALLMAETELISRYRLDLLSALSEVPSILLQIDTDTLQGAVRDAIMSKRMDYLRPACLGLRELAARNSEDVFALIRAAEISELCYEPKNGEAPVYALKVAAKDARTWLEMHASKDPCYYVRDRLSSMIASKKTCDESDAIVLIKMADRMRQSSAIPQIREAKKMLPAVYNDWIDTVIRKLENETTPIK